MPDPKDYEGNKNDEMWRVIFLVPAFIGVFEIILLLLVFKEEPITFCITNDREEEAIRHMCKVYRIKDPASTTEPIEKLLESKLGIQRQSTSMDASSTTFKQAICGKKYRKSTWVCFMIQSFNQLSGINAINVYANRLLVQMEE